MFCFWVAFCFVSGPHFVNDPWDAWNADPAFSWPLKWNLLVYFCLSISHTENFNTLPTGTLRINTLSHWPFLPLKFSQLLPSGFSVDENCKGTSVVVTIVKCHHRWPSSPNTGKHFGSMDYLLTMTCTCSTLFTWEVQKSPRDGAHDIVSWASYFFALSTNEVCQSETWSLVPDHIWGTSNYCSWKWRKIQLGIIYTLIDLQWSLLTWCYDTLEGL